MLGRVLSQRYEIVDRIGQGGMGTVYRARDLSLDRDVALKVLNRDLSVDPEVTRRFQREAEMMVRQVHPNVVRLYDVGQEDDLWFLVMEYVEGETLAWILRTEGTLSVERTVEVVRQICCALEAADALSIVHRDLKPSNILLTTDGTVKVADFGLARCKGTSDLTRSGEILGTVDYLSPEQIEGRGVDGRSDLYSLGVVMVEMLVGRPPFVGESPAAVMYKHLNEEPPSVRMWDPAIPVALDQLIRTLLAKDPSMRLESARVLTEHIEALGKSKEIPLPEGIVPPRKGSVRVPLVGRGKELGGLQGRLEQAIRGEGSLALLYGEAGIGKTRLVYELEAYARRRNVLVLKGSCGGSMGSDPYGPFVEILMGVFGIEHSDVDRLRRRKIRTHIADRLPELEEIADSLEAFLSPRADEMGSIYDTERSVRTETFVSQEAARDRQGVLFWCITQVFLHMSRKRPLFVFLDDLHGADETTVSLLEYVCRAIQTSRILLIGAVRPEEVEDALTERIQRLGERGLCEKIVLKRLNEEELIQLAEHMLGRVHVPVSFFHDLARDSEGNPLFAIEALKLVQEEGQLVEQDGTWQLVGGDGLLSSLHSPRISDLIARRVGRLSEADQRLLRYAAVEGEVFSSDALSHVLGMERMEVLRALSRLTAIHHIIYYDGSRYRFDHGRIRDALYSQLSEELRREVHLLIGTYKEARYGENVDPVLFEVAHHFHQGGDREKAIPYLVRAGDKARVLYAYREAAEYYEKAFEWIERDRPFGLEPFRAKPSDGALRAAVLEGLGEAYWRCGEMDKAIGVYEQMLEACVEPGKRAEIQRALGMIYEEQQDGPRSLQHLESALEALDEEGSPIDRAWLWLDVSYVYGRQFSNPAKALALDRKALEVLEGAAVLKDDHRLLCKLYRNLGYSHTHTGRQEEGIAYYRKALAASETLGDLMEMADCCDQLGTAIGKQADFDARPEMLDEAIGYEKRALDIYEKAGNVRRIAVMHHRLWAAYQEKRDLDRALFHAQQAVWISEPMGYPFPLLPALRNVSEHFLAKGDLERASESLRTFVERSLDLGGTNLSFEQGFASGLDLLERIAVLRGHPEEFDAFCREVRRRRAGDLGWVYLRHWHLDPLPELPDRAVSAGPPDPLSANASIRWVTDPEDRYCAYRTKTTEDGTEIRIRQHGPHTSLALLYSGDLQPARLVRRVSGPFLAEVEIERLRDEPVWTGGLILFRDLRNYAFLIFDAEDALQLYEKREGQLHLIARGRLERVRFLQLERDKAHLRAYVRAEEGPWHACGQLPEDDDGPVEVGILAYGSVTGFRTAGCRYRNFMIRRLAVKEGTRNSKFEIRNSKFETHGKHPLSSGQEAKGMEEVPMIDSLSEEHVRALYEVGRLLNGTLEWETLLEQVMDVILQVTGAERGAVLLLDRKIGDLSVVASRHTDEDTLQHAETLSYGVVRDVAARGMPRIIVDAQVDPDFKTHQSVILHGIRSILCMPLCVRGEILGTVYLDHRRSRGVFFERDLDFFRALAEQIALSVENARLHHQLQQENVRLRGEVQRRYRFPNLIGESSPMQEVFRMVERVSDSSVTVLLVGETGTGKELIARAIHYNGTRKDKAFVAQNCAALPEHLLESELFGYMRGAFTGATRDKPGLFEVADGGTLFLDEVAEMPPSTQSKLLRALQEKEIRRLGDTKPRKVDVRVIAATSRDLKKEIEAKRFRPELYYRLDVVQIPVSPLRERKEDIPRLVDHFLNQYSAEESKTLAGLTSDALDRLMAYDWPGNVRELENEIRRALALAPARPERQDGVVIRAEMLSEKLRSQARPSRPSWERKGSLREVLAEVERGLIRDALAACEGNKTKAAERLGLTRKGLRDKMTRLGL